MQPGISPCRSTTPKRILVRRKDSAEEAQTTPRHSRAGGVWVRREELGACTGLKPNPPQYKQTNTSPKQHTYFDNAQTAQIAGGDATRHLPLQKYHPTRGCRLRIEEVGNQITSSKSQDSPPKAMSNAQFERQNPSNKQNPRPR